MAREVSPGSGTGSREYLQDLVLDSSDVEVFLHELAVVASYELSSSGQEVYCGVTLIRRKKASTIASSDANARIMDEIQYGFNDGPCLTAIREAETVHVPSMREDNRWRQYAQAVLEVGIGS